MKNIKRIFMSTRKIIIEDGIYHITQRAPGREVIFAEDNDYKTFLYFLKKTSQEFAIEVFCFALMPNHVHILVKNRKENLSQAMKYLFQRYALWFNKKYERKGHVFCGAYRAALCLDDSYLIAISLYIHLNPFKAQIVKDVFSYRWSSLDCYIKSHRDSFINTKQIMELMGEKENAHLIYKDLIESVKGINHKSVFNDRCGVKKFTKKMFNSLGGRGTSCLFKKTELFKDFFHNKNVMDSVIIKQKRRKFEDKKAFKYCIEQLLARGYSFKEIAENLKVNRTTIYRLMQQKC
ncbi:MAG: transposase [Candidatus Omnitrophica bacterium]|nr:transposase [Candidatus Omnitrophota bacterium]